MVGGQAHLVQDVPPYVTVDGLSSLVVGLNKIGLRRAGYDQAAIRELMAAYRVIYRSGLPLGGAPRTASHPVPRRSGGVVLRVPLDHRPRHRLRAPRPAGRHHQAPRHGGSRAGAGSPREVRVRGETSSLLHQPQLRVGDDVVEELRHARLGKRSGRRCRAGLGRWCWPCCPCGPCGP